MFYRTGNEHAKINVNAVVNPRLSEYADISSRAFYQWQQNHYYQQLNDLLGGEFYVDLNQFAERDFPKRSQRRAK